MFLSLINIKKTEVFAKDKEKQRANLILLNVIVDARWEGNGEEDAAEWLMSFGITGKELEKMRGKPGKFSRAYWQENNNMI